MHNTFMHDGRNVEGVAIANRWWMYQQQINNMALESNTFCNLSGPQQALHQCELLVLLINIIIDGTILCKF